MTLQTLCNSACSRGPVFRLFSRVAFSLCLTGVWLAADAQAQTSVTTPPVGYMSLSVPPSAGGSSISRALVSFPLQLPAVDAQPVTAVTATTISSSAAAWTTNQFTAVPYLVMIKSGASTGRYFLVTGNTSSTATPPNQLTLNTGGTNLTQVIAVGDRYEIFPAHTFGNLFGTTSVPFLADEDYTLADNLLLQNGTNFVTYYHDGTMWTGVGVGPNDQKNTVIYPDESIYILRRGTSALSLQSLGAVPVTALQTVVPGAGRYLMANRFPVATTLKQLGLDQLPGWVGDEDYTVSDQILFQSGNIWQFFFYDGTHWYGLNTGPSSQDNYPIAAGAGYYILRHAGSTAATTVLNQALPYTP